MSEGKLRELDFFCAMARAVDLLDPKALNPDNEIWIRCAGILAQVLTANQDTLSDEDCNKLVGLGAALMTNIQRLNPTFTCVDDVLDQVLRQVGGSA